MNLSKIYYQDVENKIYKLFRDNLPEEIDVLLSPQISSNVRPDITISKGDQRLAIVEIKSASLFYRDRVGIEGWLTEYTRSLGFRYAILAIEGKTFYIKDCISAFSPDFEEEEIIDICHKLVNIHAPRFVTNTSFCNVFWQVFDDSLTLIDDNDDATRKSFTSKEINDNLLKFKEKNRNLKFLMNDTSFFFEKDGLEDVFFECLIKSFDDEKLCRYTSLSSFFRTINECTQSMCCLVGMNDKSECTYADSYISASKKTATIPVKTLYEANEENKYFILSCVDECKYDDLTMWRLYGDNTKGVNILYKVDETKIKEFRLFYIDYAETPEPNGHLSLNIIRKLLDINVDGKSFKFRKWNEWKHFFKPYEYRDELEIRLMHRKKSNTKEKWILTKDYNISCPLAIFKLSDFPLSIEEVKLGTNCPNIETNQLQLELMIKENIAKLNCVKKKDIVQTSNIATYRL